VRCLPAAPALAWLSASPAGTSALRRVLPLRLPCAWSSFGSVLVAPASSFSLFLVVQVGLALFAAFSSIYSCSLSFYGGLLPGLVLVPALVYLWFPFVWSSVASFSTSAGRSSLGALLLRRLRRQFDAYFAGRPARKD